MVSGTVLDFGSLNTVMLTSVELTKLVANDFVIGQEAAIHVSTNTQEKMLKSPSSSRCRVSFWLGRLFVAHAAMASHILLGRTPELYVPCIS
jgi:hypothetical protein